MQTTEPKNKRALDSLVDRKWKVLAMCFLVTGFLGLPLIYISPAFSKLEKWLWSIAVTIYTFILIGIATAICYWCYLQIAEIVR